MRPPYEGRIQTIVELIHSIFTSRCLCPSCILLQLFRSLLSLQICCSYLIWVWRFGLSIRLPFFNVSNRLLWILLAVFSFPFIWIAVHLHIYDTNLAVIRIWLIFTWVYCCSHTELIFLFQGFILPFIVCIAYFIHCRSIFQILAHFPYASLSPASLPALSFTTLTASCCFPLCRIYKIKLHFPTWHIFL